MELRIISPSEDGFIRTIEFNYEELKAEIAAKMEDYNTLVFTEETIKEAKVDRANLRKLKDAIEDERKRIKKLCNEPYLAFEAKVKEITALIDKPIGLIDAQIKEVEEKKKQEKQEQIRILFDHVGFPFPVTLEQIFDPKWLNASVSLKTVQDALLARQHDMEEDMKTLENLKEFGFEAQEVYKQTLNINSAIAAASRMSEIQKAKERAEEERIAREEARKAAEAQKAAEPVADPEPEAATKPIHEEVPIRFTVAFSCTGTAEQLDALKHFLIDNGIEYKPVKGVA